MENGVDFAVAVILLSIFAEKIFSGRLQNVHYFFAFLTKHTTDFCSKDAHKLSQTLTHELRHSRNVGQNIEIRPICLLPETEIQTNGQTQSRLYVNRITELKPSVDRDGECANE